MLQYGNFTGIISVSGRIGSCLVWVSIKKHRKYVRFLNINFMYVRPSTEILPTKNMIQSITMVEIKRAFCVSLFLRVLTSHMHLDFASEELPVQCEEIISFSKVLFLRIYSLFYIKNLSF